MARPRRRRSGCTADTRRMPSITVSSCVLAWATSTPASGARRQPGSTGRGWRGTPRRTGRASSTVVVVEEREVRAASRRPRCGLAVDCQRSADRAASPPNSRCASRALSTTRARRAGVVLGGGEGPAVGRLAAQHVEELPDAEPAAHPLGAFGRVTMRSVGESRPWTRRPWRRASSRRGCPAWCCRAPSPPSVWWPSMTSRSGSANGSGFRSTPWTTLKIAVLAPMASARVATQTAVNRGCARAGAARSGGPGQVRRAGESPARGRGRRADGRRAGAAAARAPVAPRTGRAPRARRAPAADARAPGGGAPRRRARRRPRPSGRRCRSRIARREQAERGAIEAYSQPGRMVRLCRGASRFCRAIFTARSRRATSSRATVETGRRDAVVAAPRVVVARPRPLVELLDQAGVEQAFDGRVERARGELTSPAVRGGCPG